MNESRSLFLLPPSKNKVLSTEFQRQSLFCSYPKALIDFTRVVCFLVNPLLFRIKHNRG